MQATEPSGHPSALLASFAPVEFGHSESRNRTLFREVCYQTPSNPSLIRYLFSL